MPQYFSVNGLIGAILMEIPLLGRCTRTKGPVTKKSVCVRKIHNPHRKFGVRSHEAKWGLVCELADLLCFSCKTEK